MKNFNNILISGFFILIVVIYWGRCFSDNYSSKNKIENASNNHGTGSQCIVISESSLEEEEVPIELPNNAVQIIYSNYEKLSPIAIVFPPKLYYSIWQPPKVS